MQNITSPVQINRLRSCCSLEELIPPPRAHTSAPHADHSADVTYLITSLLKFRSDQNLNSITSWVEEAYVCIAKQLWNRAQAYPQSVPLANYQN